MPDMPPFPPSLALGAAARIAAYIHRRTKDKFSDPDLVHGYDAGSDVAALLTIPDLLAVIQAIAVWGPPMLGLMPPETPAEEPLWWWTPHEEAGCSGPYKTREDAITAGRGERPWASFYVAQARQAPVLLGDWIGADELIERAEDAIMDSDRVTPDFDEVVFEVTPAQEADLAARIKATCAVWQAGHGLTFVPRTFSWMGELEFVPALDPEADAREPMPFKPAEVL